MDQEINRQRERKNVPSVHNTNTGEVLRQRYEYIPLDFIKTQVIGLCREHFIANDKLIFTPVLKDGDTIHFERCEIDNMKLTIYPSGWIEFAGSLHKYHNKGEHNYNDFDFEAFRSVLTRLKDEFGIEPYHLRLMTLEYGFNLQLEFEVKTLLNGLLQHKCVSFDRFDNRQGSYYQAKHERYFLKVYDKGKQYGLNFNCLRIELKDKNLTDYRRKYNINTLEDFILSDKMPFVQNLLNQWDSVVLCDLTSAKQTKWSKLNNELFWKELVPDSKASINERNALKKKRNVYRKQLKELNQKHGINIQERTKELIIAKLNELQKVTNSNIGISPRYCRLTGQNISMQRNDSHLLSHTGLYHLLEHNLIEFDKIKRRYLSGRWVQKSIEIQVKEIAHNIRSTYNKKVRRTDLNQLQLFTASGNVFQLQL
jgi:hypothetical protein